MALDQVSAVRRRPRLRPVRAQVLRLRPRAARCPNGISVVVKGGLDALYARHRILARIIVFGIRIAGEGGVIAAK